VIRAKWREFGGESIAMGAAGRIIEWVGPRVPEASDGILTSAGICEGFAGAGVSSGVLIFAGFAGLVAGTLAMGAVEYSKLRAERDQQLGQLARERAEIEAAPDAELDELAQLYVSRGLSPGLARQVAIEPNRSRCADRTRRGGVWHYARISNCSAS